jgi:hypothetical protein
MKNRQTRLQKQRATMLKNARQRKPRVEKLDQRMLLAAEILSTESLQPLSSPVAESHVSNELKAANTPTKYQPTAVQLAVPRPKDRLNFSMQPL